MAERWRFYLAGAMHAVGGVWLAGWALSHWVPTLDPLFGPQGWLPAPIGLMFLTLSIPLVLLSQRADRPRSPAAGTTAPAGRGDTSILAGGRREYGSDAH